MEYYTFTWLTCIPFNLTDMCILDLSMHDIQTATSSGMNSKWRERSILLLDLSLIGAFEIAIRGFVSHLDTIKTRMTV